MMRLDDEPLSRLSGLEILFSESLNKRGTGLNVKEKNPYGTARLSSCRHRQFSGELIVVAIATTFICRSAL